MSKRERDERSEDKNEKKLKEDPESVVLQALKEKDLDRERKRSRRRRRRSRSRSRRRSRRRGGRRRKRSRVRRKFSNSVYTNSRSTTPRLLLVIMAVMGV